MTIAENLKEIEARICAACERSGRVRSEVTLVGVSKRKPASAIAEALETTELRHFGENYVQEYVEKRELLSVHTEAKWHLIGHLQRNKVRQLMAYPPVLIHSVDSIALANQIERVMSEVHAGKVQDILAELRIGDEDGEKTGMAAAEADSFIEHMKHCPHLKLRGLMLIPPVCENVDDVRPYFAEIRSIFERLNAEKGLQMDILSYGMSHDFEAAIEEGATHIRIGTAIFGART